MAIKDTPQQRPIPNIPNYKFRTPVGDFFDPIDNFTFAITKVVEDNDLVTRFEQLHNGMGTNVAGTAGNENSLCCKSHDIWVCYEAVSN